MSTTARQSAFDSANSVETLVAPRIPSELPFQEEQYRLLFELNPCPMWVFDVHTLRFLDVNQAAVKLYGWSRHGLLGRTVKDIRRAGESPKLLKQLTRQKRSGLAFAGVWKHRKKNGAEFDVEVNIGCIRFQNRDARLAMVTDITERKRALEALRASEKRYRT